MRCFTRERSEARGQQALKPSVCLSRHVLPVHSLTSAVLPPLEGTCSHHPTNGDALRWPHENLPELSSKRSCRQYTSTSDYITHIQQCMTMAQPNKPMTAQILPELVRQSAVTLTYLRGLGGLPQHSPSAPQLAP